MPGSRNNIKETHYERSFTFNDEVLQQIIQTTKKTISIYFCCTRNFQETGNLQPIVSDNFCMVIHVWFVQFTTNVFKSRTTIYIFNILTTYVFFAKQYKGRYILVTFKWVRCKLRARTEFVIKHFLFLKLLQTELNAASIFFSIEFDKNYLLSMNLWCERSILIAFNVS